MAVLREWKHNRVILAALVFLLVGNLGCGYWLWHTWQAEASTPAAQAFAFEDGSGLFEDEPEPNDEIVVYITGEVYAPDVYILPKEARIKDLVMAAGGMTNQADTTVVNLAERLSDEQKVVIPARAARASSGISSSLLDLNTATQSQLEALPDIGESLAGRILEYREQNGPFSQIEDLREISGISSKVYDKIETLITIGS